MPLVAHYLPAHAPYVCGWCAMCVSLLLARKATAPKVHSSDIADKVTAADLFHRPDIGALGTRALSRVRQARDTDEEVGKLEGIMKEWRGERKISRHYCLGR